MRKITLLLSLLITSFSFSQVVLTEDFEAGLSLPAGWTNNDIAGGGEIWTFSDSAETPSAFTTPNTYMYSAAELAGNYAIFDSDGYGGAIAEEASLESPVFDCSSLTSVRFSFNHFFTEGYDGEGHVEVYNGSSWVEVATYSTATVTGGYDLGYVDLDVTTELAGVSNAQVRFRWVGDYSWWWAVDNISVYQCTVGGPFPATLTSIPDGTTDVAITDTGVGPFEWTPAALGGPADYYNLHIGLTATGDDLGYVGNMTNGNNINYAWEYGTTYYWYVEAVNCADSANSSVWSFTTEPCLLVSAPAAASAPVPADAATDVVLDYTANGNALAFIWTDSGDPNESITLNIGTANPPTNSFSDFASGETLTGLATSQTYYWSIDITNCFGTTNGPVWSFTTSATLSTDDNELVTNDIKLYPNPATDFLNIKTSMDIDSIEIFNLLGQSVMRFTNDQVINDSVNISKLVKGLYLVKVSAGDKTQTFNVVKE